MDKKKVDNTKTNKKRVNNTNFKTNLTVQAVCERNTFGGAQNTVTELWVVDFVS